MAHTIQVPVSFEFRTIKTKWTDCVARIVSWEGEDFGAEVKIKGRSRSFTLAGEHVPSELRRRCTDAIESDFGGGHVNNDVVEQICSDFRPQLFLPSKHKSFLDPEDMKGSLPADAWQLREAFLRLTPDRAGILAFLNRWGRWGGWKGRYVYLPEFLNFQQQVRTALVSAPDEWFESLHSGLDSLETYSEFPYLGMPHRVGR